MTRSAMRRRLQRFIEVVERTHGRVLFTNYSGMSEALQASVARSLDGLDAAKKHLGKALSALSARD